MEELWNLVRSSSPLKPKRGRNHMESQGFILPVIQPTLIFVLIE